MGYLTHEDLTKVVMLATTSYHGGENRWIERAKVGLSDTKLSEAIRYELGIAGGTCGSSIGIAVSYEGAGLKIWATKGGSHNCSLEEPVLTGNSTLKMVRAIYKIPNPEDDQLALF